MLSKLIEAMQIFLKYENPNYPTHCEHDVLTVCISPSKVSDEDKAKLEELGFHVVESEGCFQSYRYGSA
jgi:hypothetical protein